MCLLCSSTLLQFQYELLLHKTRRRELGLDDDSFKEHKHHIQSVNQSLERIIEGKAPVKVSDLLLSSQVWLSGLIIIREILAFHPALMLNLLQIIWIIFFFLRHHQLQIQMLIMKDKGCKMKSNVSKRSLLNNLTVAFF